MADGTVIIIGGAEDKVRDRVILTRFVALAGGEDATIAVISTASSLGLEAGERYGAIFGDLGVKRVRPLHAVTRPQANDETAIRAIHDATGVWIHDLPASPERILAALHGIAPPPLPGISTITSRTSDPAPSAPDGDAGVPDEGLDPQPDARTDPQPMRGPYDG